MHQNDPMKMIVVKRENGKILESIFFSVSENKRTRFATVPCSLFTESVLLRARFPVQRFFF